MPIRVTSKQKKAAAPIGAALPFGLPQPPPDRVQKPAGISLCMIVKNEERFLAQCLRSVADAVDEIVVVDTGSTDATIEIAKSFGAIVVEREWRNDFSWARNQSIELATKRWILFLDADEELTPESKPLLAQLKNVPTHQSALFVRCFNESNDYRGTGAMSHALVRIFPNAPEIRFRGLIHEFPTVNNSINGLHSLISPISIVHHGYLKEVVAERNKGERNLEMVKAATEADPSDAYNWFNLGTTAFLVGDFAGARDGLERMREINGSEKRGFVPSGLAVLAEIYGDKLQQPVQGEAIARECLKVAPRFANAHFQLGKCLIAQQRYDEARAAFLDAIEDGNHAHLQFVVDDQVYRWKSHSEIGSTYVMQGDDEKAAEWFRRGLENAPTVAPLRTNLARSLDRLGRHVEAEAMFRALHAEHVDDTTAIDLVNFLLRRGNGLDALSIIERSHESLSDDAASAMLVGAAQIAMRHGLPNAVEYLRAAADRTPGSAEVLNPFEAMLRERGDEQELARVLERESTISPRAAADFLRRAYQALQRNEFAEAAKHAADGLALAPNDGRLHYNAALANARCGNRAIAIEHLRAIEPGDGETYGAAELLLAATERDGGNLDEAIAAVERLLAVAPENLDGIALRANLYEERGDAGKAEHSLRALYARDRQRGGVELASFYLRQQRFAEAASIADEALKR